MCDNYLRGVLMALGTAILWGCMSPLSKFLGKNGVSPISVMCWRTVIVVFVIGVWLTLRRHGQGWWRISGKLGCTYLLLAFLTVVMNACGFMMSCVCLTIPQALMIHYTFPLVTMAGSWFITKEVPTYVQVASGGMIIVGLYIGFVGGRSTDFASVSGIGVIWAVISLIGLSGQTLISRRILRDGTTDPLKQLFFIHLFGGLMIIVGKSVLIGWNDLAFITPTVFALMMYAAIGAGLLGFGCMFSALRYIQASLVSLICTLEIIFALAITPFALGLYPTCYELTGCAIIVMAVICATLSQRIL